mgnify:FL=1
MSTKNQTSKTTYILWAVYISLLGVLLPHTAWAFKNWEPEDSNGFISYVAAFAFEAAIAVLTHKLSKRIEQTPKSRKKWHEKFSYRYINGIAFGLVIATIVSALANLAHAVGFGKEIKIFTDWGIPMGVYSVVFGGILPLVSLTFANVLSNVVDDEDAPSPEVIGLNETIRSLRQQVREAEGRVKATEELVKATEGIVKVAEERAKLSEDRFGAISDLVKYLFGEDKRQRIITARKQWRELRMFRRCGRIIS